MPVLLRTEKRSGSVSRSFPQVSTWTWTCTGTQNSFILALPPSKPQISSLKITQTNTSHQPEPRLVQLHPLFSSLNLFVRPQPPGCTHSQPRTNRRHPINPKRPPSGISIVRGEAPLLQRASSWLLGALLSLPLQPRQINTVSNRPLSLPSITAACLVSSATQTALCSLLPALSQKTLPLLISNQDRLNSLACALNALGCSSREFSSLPLALSEASTFCLVSCAKPTTTSLCLLRGCLAVPPPQLRVLACGLWPQHL